MRWKKCFNNLKIDLPKFLLSWVHSYVAANMDKFAKFLQRKHQLCCIFHNNTECNRFNSPPSRSAVLHSC